MNAALPSIAAALLQTAALQQPEVPSVGPSVVAAQASLDCVFDGRTGLPVLPQDALARIKDASVVYLGESHDNAAHHRAQTQVIAALAAAGKRPAGAFEMLYASHQAALDRYLSGGDEASFLLEVDWKRTWGYSFELYRPVFEALKGNRLPGLALNIPRSLITKIRKEGLASLTPEERALLPEDVQLPTDPAYLEMLRGSYLAHGYDPEDAAAYERFLASQSAWNEGMAWRVSEYLTKDPNAQVVVIAGGFHAYDAAMPAGVARRVPGVRQATVILSEAAECPARLDPADLPLAADLVWVVRP